MNAPKTILIVEDESDIREALRDVLREKGYRVLEAQNGREGVALALGEHPDLVLLDLIMPVLGGMETFALIRRDVWGRHAKVIILTNVTANKEQLVEDTVTHKPVEYLIKSDWRIYDMVKKVETMLG